MEDNLDYALSKNLIVTTDIKKSKKFITADKIRLEKVLNILFQTAATRADSKKIFEISTIEEKNSIKFSIIYTPKNCLSEEMKNFFKEVPQYSAIGQGLKIHYCKKVLDNNNSRPEISQINTDCLKIGFELKS